MGEEREAELEAQVRELVSWLTGAYVFVSEGRVEELDAFLGEVLLGSGAEGEAGAGAEENAEDPPS